MISLKHYSDVVALVVMTMDILCGYGQSYDEVVMLCYVYLCFPENSWDD